jgi:DHA1 family bicyclomycin/chloramphenicol resistance-like MFS transporter
MMVLMLGLLACVAPATIDAYLPAFAALEREFGVPQETVQLTLGVYMFCYAAMLLLHGTLSDSLGRRRVILATLVFYICGSALAAAAPSFGWLLAARALQGLSAGAGIVVGQAIVRDCYEGPAAQRVMSYLILVFNLSPALAPIIGGQLAAQLGWRAVIVMLAALAATAWALCAWRLPETLPASRRRPLSGRALAGGYGALLADRRYVALAAAFSLIFAAQGLLIGAAPDFIANVLGLPVTDFAYLFVPLVIGAMAGALFAARKAGRWTDQRITWLAYLLMGGSCLASVMYAAGAGRPGLAMCVPAMTLHILARAPGLSGTAASVLGFAQMLAFSVASGWGVPMVYGKPLGLALAMLACVAASAAGWAWLQRQSAPLANARSG